MSFQKFIYYIQNGDIESFLANLKPEFVNRVYDPQTKWRPIHLAAGYGRIEIVSELITNKCEINALTMDKSHALHLAARFGHAEIVKILISKHCDIERRNMAYERPIHSACRYGWITVVQLLLDNGSPINSKAENLWTCLHYAARYNHSETIRLLLQNDAKPEARTTDGLTALDIAKRNNYQASINMLEMHQIDTQYGCQSLSSLTNSLNNVTPQFSDANTPWEKMLLAVKNNDLEGFTQSYDPKYLSKKEADTDLGLLDLLIENGATEMLDVVLGEDIEDDVLVGSKIYAEYGEEILDHYSLYKAIRFRNEEMWNKCANVQIINEPFIMTNESFLAIAVRYGQMMFTRMVYEMFLDGDETWTKIKEKSACSGNQCVAKMIDERDGFLKSRKLAGWNRLHISVYDNRDDVVQYILTNGLVDPSCVDSCLNTPLNLALILGHQQCAKILLRYEKEPNRRNKYGQTMLHLSIDGSMLDLTNDILQRTIDLSRKDMLKLNVLTTAIVNGNEKICEMILNKEKIMLTEIMKFDKSILEILSQFHFKNAPPLTGNETYFSLCLKLNGEIYSSLLTRMKGVMSNVLDGNNNSLLHIATQLLLVDLCKYIIRVGGTETVNLKNKEGNTPLHQFLIQRANKHTKIDRETFEDFIKLFLDTQAAVISKNCAGQSLVQSCLKLNDERLFQRIFTDHINTPLSEFELLEILERNWFSTLEKFIPQILSSVLSLFLNPTTIIKLIENCSNETIKVILSSANPSIIDEVREQLLIVAAQRGLDDIFDMLLDETIRDFKLLSDGETILTSLLRDGYHRYCRRMLYAYQGFGLMDQRNSNGQTALHLVADCQDMEMLEHMLLESVHWEYADKDDNTVLGILLRNISSIIEASKIKEVEKMIKIIIRGGQDIYSIGSGGQPIIDSCNDSNLRMVFEKFQKSVKPSARKYVIDEEEKTKNICQICLDSEVDRVLQCGHPFCKNCVSQLRVCPACREPIQKQQKLYL